MHKNFLVAGALLSAVAVILGAFGAHGLQKITADDKIIDGYQTAVQYQMWHSLALVLTGIIFGAGVSVKYLKPAALCFITGIILFSGSIYLLTFLKIQGSTLVKTVGPITPVGGLFFIAGWLLLGLAVLKKKPS